MKNRIRVIVVSLLALYPFVVGYTPPDPDNWTIVDVILGFGSYYQVLARDCNGNVTSAINHPFQEWGGTIRHHFANDFLMEGRVGTISSDGVGPLLTTSTNTTPSAKSTQFFGGGIGIEGEGGGIESGVLYFQNPISLLNGYSNIEPYGSVRLGSEQRLHFTFGVLDNPTIMSSGGLMDMGVGFPMDADGSSTCWLGLGGGVYNDVQIVARLVIAPRNQSFSFLLNANTGLGASPTSTQEYGLSGGVRWKF